MHTPTTLSHLIELPYPLAGFGSVTISQSPFETFLAYLAREVNNPSLTFATVKVPPAVFGNLRQATKEWARARRVGQRLDDLTAQGVTAPWMVTAVPPGHAMVEVAHG